MERKAFLVDSKDKTLCEGVLLAVINGEAVFEAERRKELDHYQKDEPIRLKVFDNSNGIRYFQGTINTTGNRRMYIGSLEEEKTIQRREDVKAYLNLDVSIRDLRDPRKTIPVKIKDISAGGIGFFTRAFLEKKGTYEVVIPNTKYPVIVNFKIIRQVVSEDGYIYGCKFVNLRMGEESLIRQMVFRQLAEKRKKEKARQEEEELFDREEQ